MVAGLEQRFPANSGVLLGGAVFAQHQIGDSVSEDLGRAELLAFPILLLLSICSSAGAPRVLPLAVGMTTVLGTFLVLTVVNQAYHLSIFALNLVIGLGLGLAIDYTLFLVTRFREELAKDNPDAVRTTMQTAGRTVAFSAVTVALALITLTVFPLGFLKSMGIAGAAVALVAGAAALVIAPADVRDLGPEAGREAAQALRRLVPARARRHAPPAPDRARHRRADARDRPPLAARGVDAGRLDRDPEGPDRAHRRRHRRPRLRRRPGSTARSRSSPTPPRRSAIAARVKTSSKACER